MNGKSTAFRIVLAQLAMALAVGGVAWAVGGAGSGLAALVGGLINVVASLYFALQVFSGGVRPAQSVLRSFYIGEVVKFLITAALFGVAVALWRLDVLPLLAGFGLTLVVYWLALLPAGAIHRWNRA
jgi:ATP synthase protein I